jgi:hypothetical protein
VRLPKVVGEVKADRGGVGRGSHSAPARACEYAVGRSDMCRLEHRKLLRFHGVTRDCVSYGGFSECSLDGGSGTNDEIAD